MDEASGSGSVEPSLQWNEFVEPVSKRKRKRKINGESGADVADADADALPPPRHAHIQNEALAIARDRSVILQDEENGRKKLLDVLRQLKSDDHVRAPIASKCRIAISSMQWTDDMKAFFVAVKSDYFTGLNVGLIRLSIFK